jgi:maintenance of morphology protein 1
MNALTAFFLGQLSLALLIFCFIKYFIFGEPPPEDASTATKRRLSSGLLRTPRLRRMRSALLRPDPPVQPSAILSKTFYNVSGHLPESLDWFNVLLAQTLAQLRTEALHDDALLKSLDEVLNGTVKPDFVGPITITELALGEEFPIFSNCRIIPVDEGGVEVKSVGESTRLLARLDLDLSDAITLGVETKLMLNYPVPLVAVLPVALAVSVVRFSGTVSGHALRCNAKSLDLALVHPLYDDPEAWRRRRFVARPNDTGLLLPPRLPPRSLRPVSTWLTLPIAGRAENRTARRGSHSRLAERALR